MSSEAELREELDKLAASARVRRSADLRARAYLESMALFIAGGVVAKLLHDSVRLPVVFYPLALLALLLAADAFRQWRAARRLAADEDRVLARLQEVRRALGLDMARR
jgi:hypothetical protein